MPSLTWLSMGAATVYGCMVLMFCPEVKCFQSALFRGDEASVESSLAIPTQTHTHTHYATSITLKQRNEVENLFNS